MAFKKKLTKPSDFTKSTKRPNAAKLKKLLISISHEIDRHGEGIAGEYHAVLKDFMSQFTTTKKTPAKTKAPTKTQVTEDKE